MRRSVDRYVIAAATRRQGLSEATASRHFVEMGSVMRGQLVPSL